MAILWLINVILCLINVILWLIHLVLWLIQVVESIRAIRLIRQRLSRHNYNHGIAAQPPPNPPTESFFWPRGMATQATLPDERFFDFLRRLSRNNDRDWFQKHKSEFQVAVQSPAVELVRHIEGPLHKIAPFIEPVVKPNGGSVMRIYRDTRFSKDKTPYKNHVGISLKHAAGKQSGAPELYLHLSPNESFLAGGCWRPARQPLAAIRSFIDSHPKQWSKATASKLFRHDFHLGGESLKTSPRDYPADHGMIDEIKRIDFVAVAPLSVDEIVSPDFVAHTIKRFRKLRPMMECLCESIGVPY